MLESFAGAPGLMECMHMGTIRTSKGRSPTMGDVARLAGVSPTTVSFVLNDVVGSGNSEATSTRVRASARELRYRPNATARLLRTDRSYAIGFVTDEIASTAFRRGRHQGCAGGGLGGRQDLDDSEHRGEPGDRGIRRRDDAGAPV